MRLIIAIVVIGMIPYSLADDEPAACGKVFLEYGCCCQKRCNSDFSYKGNEAFCPDGQTIMAGYIPVNETNGYWLFVPKLVCTDGKWEKQHYWAGRQQPTDRFEGYVCIENLEANCTEPKVFPCPAKETCQDPIWPVKKNVVTCPQNTKLISNNPFPQSHSWTDYKCHPPTQTWIGWTSNYPPFAVNCLNIRTTTVATTTTATTTTAVEVITTTTEPEVTTTEADYETETEGKQKKEEEKGGNGVMIGIIVTVVIALLIVAAIVGIVVAKKKSGNHAGRKKGKAKARARRKERERLKI